MRFCASRNFEIGSRHQDVGVHQATVALARFGQNVLETTVVLIRNKNRAAVIPPLDNVLGLTGQNVTR